MGGLFPTRRDVDSVVYTAKFILYLYIEARKYSMLIFELISSVSLREHVRETKEFARLCNPANSSVQFVSYGEYRTNCRLYVARSK
jgi:hypothetical protein